ncbi:hypothetical protein RP20_CCG003943 [Aedes albopictus]|nr:hypothetical protein RP20_CCG003943 [Aedes albopictus]
MSMKEFTKEKLLEKFLVEFLKQSLKMFLNKCLKEFLKVSLKVFVKKSQESFAVTKLGEYSGTAGDGLSYHKGSKFSTMDMNNDVQGNNGAVDWTGAWWYKKGHYSNLNGQYLLGKVDHTKFHGKGMTWNPFRGDDYSLKRSRMMIKRVLNQ